MWSSLRQDVFSRAPSRGYPDPFQDYATRAMPESISQALRWGEVVFATNGTYREAARRLVSYFITELEFEDVGDDVRDTWRMFFEEVLDIRSLLHTVGMDLMCYNNSFTSLVGAFTRYLTCEKCNSVERTLREVMESAHYNFRWSSFQFCAKCPSCGHFGPWRSTTRPTGDYRNFAVRRWSPHDIELLYARWTGERKFLWKISHQDRTDIEHGYQHILESTPQRVIDAVRRDENLVFGADYIHHMREESLAGIDTGGWGFPRAVINARPIFHHQVLHRAVEAVATEHLLPIRLITPAPGSGSSAQDVLLGHDANMYMSAARRMVYDHRRDPNAVHTLPFPINYMSLGGDGKALAPTDLLVQSADSLLNAVGIPADLYRGTLSVQTFPAAVRLFEACNAAITHAFNSFVAFIARKAAAMLRWEPVKVRLKRVTHADDVARQAAKLQLGSSGMIAPSTMLDAVGIDYKSDVQRRMDDQRYMAEQEKELQERMDLAAGMQQMTQPQPQGSPSAEGDPNSQPSAGQSILAGLPAGSNVKVTPQEMEARAQTIIAKLRGMPEGEKDSTLIQLSKVDPYLHAVVTKMRDQERQQLQTRGGAILAQQQAQMAKQAGLLPIAERLRRQAAAAHDKIGAT